MYSYRETSTDRQYYKDTALIDAIAQQQPVANVFPSAFRILPLDIKKSLDMTALSSNADMYVYFTMF